MARDPRIALLLEILDEAFDHKAWHGTTLRGALKGVSPRQALWKPGAGRNSVWDLVLHTAYWKYTVRRRLTGERAGSFPRAPSNWPRHPSKPDAKAWRADVALLEAEHAALRAVVASLPARALDAKSAKGTWRQR